MYYINRIGLTIATGLLACQLVLAQSIITFEEFEIGTDTFWNGIDQSGGFTSEAVFFYNTYNPNFGGYWEAGWALSSRTDTITSGPDNLFSAKTGIGVDDSGQYAVGQQNTRIVLTENVQGKSVNGLYLTNTTYTHNSMRDGDDFAKKFGGETEDDPDFFKISIKKWYEGVLSTDSVEFYLADYRFDDNSMDYIVDTWEWVDLTTLGAVDSLVFTLFSSDVSGIWLNTPAFFAMDNLTVSEMTSIKKTATVDNRLSIYPNPTTDAISVDWSDVSMETANITIFDVHGQLVTRRENVANASMMNVNGLAKGMYFVRVELETTQLLQQLTVQ